MHIPAAHYGASALTIICSDTITLNNYHLKVTFSFNSASEHETRGSAQDRLQFVCLNQDDSLSCSCMWTVLVGTVVYPGLGLSCISVSGGGVATRAVPHLLA